MFDAGDGDTDVLDTTTGKLVWNADDISTWVWATRHHTAV